MLRILFRGDVKWPIITVWNGFQIEKARTSLSSLCSAIRPPCLVLFTGNMETQKIFPLNVFFFWSVHIIFQACTSGNSNNSLCTGSTWSIIIIWFIFKYEITFLTGMNIEVIKVLVHIWHATKSRQFLLFFHWLRILFVLEIMVIMIEELCFELAPVQSKRLITIS